ncbi:hypothetical protein ABZ871_33955 [Streptomyces populi]
MRSVRKGGRSAVLFISLAFAMAPASGYAADSVPTSTATTVDSGSDAGQTDDSDTLPDEPSGLSSVQHIDCDHSGHTGDPRERCTKLENGWMVHGKKTVDNYTRAYTRYEKNGGGSVSLKLGYTRNGSEHWSSYFTMRSGDSKVKSWNYGHMNLECTSSIGLLQQRGQDKRQTPIAKC